MAEDFVSLTEAARLLGCSRTSMSRRVDEGQFPSFADPVDRRRVLIRRADLTAVLDERPQPREIPSKSTAAGVAA